MDDELKKEFVKAMDIDKEPVVEKYLMNLRSIALDPKEFSDF